MPALLSSSLRSSCLRLLAAQNGNVAIIFALAIIPVMLVVGVTIDYGRAASARTAMQSAADAAALMASKDAVGLTASALQTKGASYFKAQLNRPDVTNVAVSTVYSPPSTSSGASVTIEASGNVPNTFMSMPILGGLTNTKIATSSTVRWGNSRYRVALALDNTGSMASASKMTELKKAATQLINDFYNMARTDADIYISIVPFAETVRIATSFKNANWLKWSGGTDGDSWDDLNGTCRFLIITLPNNDTRKKCATVSGTTWTPKNGPANWDGCVMDRDKDFDTNDTTPATSPAGSMVWPYADTLCPNEMLGMTSVRAQKQLLLDKISAMTPNGATNQTIGMAWAWMTHKVAAGPYPAPAKEANYDYQDVIILLTDGANTRNRWNGDGNNPSPEVDARQRTLCSNLAAAQFKVFSIQVSTSAEPVSAVTKACATKPDDPTYYSNVTLASQISVKFKDIFGELAKLRISK